MWNTGDNKTIISAYAPDLGGYVQITDNSIYHGTHILENQSTEITDKMVNRIAVMPYIPDLLNTAIETERGNKYRSETYPYSSIAFSVIRIKNETANDYSEYIARMIIQHAYHATRLEGYELVGTKPI